MDPVRVAIVGGGIAGLSAAYALEAQAAEPCGVAVEVHLLEASRRLGGKLRSEWVGHLLLEHGPDALFVRSPTALDFCHRLGLGDQIVPANSQQRQSFVLRGGRLHPLPDGMETGVPRSLAPLAATRLLSPIGKLRAGLELGVPVGRADADESVDAFVRRRFGAEVAERIAAPLLGGIYSTQTRELSLQATLPHLRDAERRYGSLLRAAWAGHSPSRPKANGRPASPFVSLSGGLESLSVAVAGQLRQTRVSLATPVRSLTALGPTNGRFRLELGDRGRLVADQVIVAAPAWVAANLLEAVSPAAAVQLARIRYASVIVAALAFPAAAGRHLPNGSGALLAPDEGSLLSACSWSSRKWPHCAPDGELLVRCHISVDQHPECRRLDDPQLLGEIRRELRERFGITAAPLLARVFRWPGGVATYTLGHLQRLAAIEDALLEIPGLALAGAGYRGVGVLECVRQGQAAAERVLVAAAAREPLAGACHPTTAWPAGR